MTTETTIIDPAVTEAARAALPEAAFGMAVFEPLEMAKDYVGALHCMTSDPDFEERLSRPMWRLICHVADLLDEIEGEATKVYLLGRKAVGGLPDLPDDGDGKVEESAGDVGPDDTKLVELGTRLRTKWDAQRAALARGADDESDTAHDEGIEIVRQIEAIRTTTLEGLRIKAMAVAWAYGGGPLVDEGADVTDANRLVVSLLRDLDTPHLGPTA